MKVKLLFSISPLERHCATSRKVSGSIPRTAEIFPVASDRSICPWDDSASKSGYHDIAGGKSGRCARLTTYNLHVPIVKNSGGLNILETCGPLQACNGIALPLHFTSRKIFCLDFVPCVCKYGDSLE